MQRFRRCIALILMLGITAAAIGAFGACSFTPRDLYIDDLPYDGGEPARVRLTVTRLVPQGTVLGIELEVSSEPELTPALTVNVKDSSGKRVGRVSESLRDGASTVSAECGRSLETGEYVVQLEVYAGSRIPEAAYELKLKDGLPQLTADGVYAVLAAMTDTEKCALVTGVAEPVKAGASGGTFAIERLGVPSVTLNDGPQGVRYGTTVLYPSMSNVASSWDRELAASVGRAIGEDALAQGIDVVLGPGMNIQKNVLGGRNFEYCSEDPLLTGCIAAAYVNGMQSSGAGACLKHFAVNNQEAYRGSVSSDVSERALREIYLKGFELAVKASQPMSVMSSYNAVNGAHTSVSSDLLTGILRGEWGYRGVVMSDWGSYGSVTDKVNAQNDLNMPGGAGDVDNALAALENGGLDRAALDRSCVNILTAVTESATFQALQMNTGVKTDEHSALAGKLAADTIVLLKNDGGALPLADGATLSLFGDAAWQIIFGGAGSGSVSPSRTVGLFTALDEEPRINVSYSDLPEDADAALFVISRNSTEGEDNKDGSGGFLLTEKERTRLTNLAESFRSAGKKVIVLLNTGNPIETASWRDSVDAILWCGYAGQETGSAVAKVLTGKVNPSAKTTITWPETYDSVPSGVYFPGSTNDAYYYEDIYVGYRYYTTFGADTAYPFGYGLSYTTFEYSALTVTPAEGGGLDATLTVTNTGMVSGREVAQIYVSKPETGFEQAALELAGFAKTDLLKPGHSQKITVHIGADALKTYDTANSRWVIDRGEYVFRAGSSSETLFAPVTYTYDELTVVQDVENRCAPRKELPVISKATYTAPDAAARVNLALGASVTSTACEGSYLAAYAVDGDKTTRWGSDPAGEAYIEVDLGAVQRISGIYAQLESAWVPYRLEYSVDGAQYTELAHYEKDNLMVYVAGLDIEARYIRFVREGENWFSFWEIEVYGAEE